MQGSVEAQEAPAKTLKGRHPRPCGWRALPKDVDGIAGIASGSRLPPSAFASDKKGPPRGRVKGPALTGGSAKTNVRRPKSGSLLSRPPRRSGRQPNQPAAVSGEGRAARVEAGRGPCPGSNIEILQGVRMCEAAASASAHDVPLCDVVLLPVCPWLRPGERAEHAPRPGYCTACVASVRSLWPAPGRPAPIPSFWPCHPPPL